MRHLDFVPVHFLEKPLVRIQYPAELLTQASSLYFFLVSSYVFSIPISFTGLFSVGCITAVALLAENDRFLIVALYISGSINKSSTTDLTRRFFILTRCIYYYPSV